MSGDVPASTWTRRLKVHEFALLNGSWAGPVATLDQAVEAMLAAGVARLAPLAFDAEFDPDYYREVHPEYADLDDPAAYAKWLFEDLPKNWPGSPQEHMRMIGAPLDAYPEAFDWRAYIERRPETGPNRWSAFEHLLREGFSTDPDLQLRPDEAAAFYFTLGDYYRGRDDRLAIAAFERSLAAGRREHATLHHLADAYFRQERWADALAFFQQAAAFEEAGLWTFVNGAKAANRLGDFEAALTLLGVGQARLSGDVLWREVVAETLDAQFGADEAEARRLIAGGRRAEADALLLQATARVSEQWRTFDPLGFPLPATGDGRVVMLANNDLRQCTHYRVEQKQELFAHLGRTLQVFDMWSEVDQFISALPGASAAIIYRAPAFPRQIRAIEVARAMGVPTLYDIDDLVFDSAHYPEPFETYGGITREFHEGLQLGPPLFRAAMSLCDYGIASTAALAEYMKPVVRTGEVFVLPNGVDSRNRAMLDQAPARVRRGGDFVIFYGSGTTAHNRDFLDLAGQGLLELLRSRKTVRLVVVGHLELDAQFAPFRDRITELPWTPTVQDYWSVLAEADLNIAVLTRSPTTDSKSEIKWLEAAAAGVPSIVSDTDRYREVLEDGVDALIAEDAGSWSVALHRMANDAELRAELVKAARAKAVERYSVERNAETMATILSAVAAPSPAARDNGRKPRVLLLNIFFPPQTIGGSTRVVRDNLDAWLDSPARDAFDFAVVASDNGGDLAHQVRVENYRGVPVFRITPEFAPNMEWRPFDPEAGAIFRNILRTWAPDLVHFHCVQRLTASVIEACRAEGIPYLITLHDAWYLSDWHFLVDGEGRVHPPCEDLPTAPPPGVSVGESIERRRRLRPLLEGAEAALGVSRTFTAIHHGCGFPQVRAVPNGVPPLAAAARTTSPSGRVRLAHVGSQTPHKGYDLVRAALKGGDFRNLELTVIDHRRYGGPVEHAVWGGTPVRFVGKTPQERMHDFYAHQDVLLAPSIWPESFGLVSREALAAGLWVLASDVGAIGEDVTPGVNGWVVDVSSLQPITDAFAAMNAQAARYLQPPPPKPLRTAADQAAELLDIYREVLARRPEKSAAPASDTVRDVSVPA